MSSGVFLLVSALYASSVNGYGINFTTCATLAMEVYLASPNDTFLLDQNGMPTSDLTQAWGISAESARILCSSAPMDFDWIFFAGSMTVWLIPWLVLASQLPFGTKNRKTDLLAMLLAMGSPALAVYSLTLHVLNSRWINLAFEEVIDLAGPGIESQGISAIKATKTIFIETQHFPIKIYNGPDREIAQLIVDPENVSWWTGVLCGIQGTKQTWTYPLYAQVGSVFAIQILAIVVYLQTASQDTSIGIGLAVNCLWSWMIMVVLGWICVGTQPNACAFRIALEKVPVPVLCKKTQIRGRCIGIRDRTSKDDTSLSGKDDSEEFRQQTHVGEEALQSPIPRTSEYVPVATQTDFICESLYRQVSLSTGKDR